MLRFGGNKSKAKKIKKGRNKSLAIRDTSKGHSAWRQGFGVEGLESIPPPPIVRCGVWGGGGVSWLVGFFTKLYSNTMEKAFNAFPCFCGLFCGLHFFRLHFHAIYCSRSLLVSALSTAFTRFLLFPVEIPHFFYCLILF